ncbi:phage prohead protease, HK97 family [Actinomyces bovis]|uniref:Phage prohead protease, HK97 family n=1 Tax=Actinomyces bovis TaxID=1658 RepID=A0ABY1VNW1_9ACTO|nr:HK97 family phage prohead protease [Actinomyces bovis]SPT53793.1 phage prohead protease, HK97 family [Actinomyces bovis]VEG53146.1 phage prohead protease, HK97 family [Actinomyces israelii]
MNFKTAEVKIKAGPADDLEDGEFVVYAATFTRVPDAYGDVIAPGAFTNTIKEWKQSGNTLPGLFGHRTDDPDYWVASAADMGQDHHGWWVRGKFDLDLPKGRQVYRLVKSRRLTQMSFAFDVLDSATVTLEDGTKANELRALKVYEFSFVAVGANQDTSVVAVKDAVNAVATGMKAGRVLAQKHLDGLHTAIDAIQAVIDAAEVNQTNDQEKASAEPAVKPEEPAGAKGQEQHVPASARALAAQAACAVITTL